MSEKERPKIIHCRRITEVGLIDDYTLDEAIKSERESLERMLAVLERFRKEDEEKGNLKNE